jgi:hypothetical protein
VLDASECPPTFRSPPGLVVGIIAGGHTALTTAVEGEEDSPASGARDVKALKLTVDDVVVGITASGRAPYVLGAVKAAAAAGCCVAAVVCNLPSPLATLVVSIPNAIVSLFYVNVLLYCRRLLCRCRRLQPAIPTRYTRGKYDMQCNRSHAHLCILITFCTCFADGQSDCGGC